LRPLNPFSALFGAGVAMRNALYDRKLLAIQRLSRPVVSVGNISVGGSGKTPFVIALGALLKQHGIAFDVLSRGYGRSSTEVAVVDPHGSSAEFGDEPLLIARSLDVPVIVGPERYRAGLLAESRFYTQLHLLDDGFQHRQVHREFDIVMLPAADTEDSLLPTGRLREPITALSRADAIASADDLLHLPIAPRLHHFWKVRRELRFKTEINNAIAFCGIARPNQFFRQITGTGIRLAKTVSFADHHRYREADIVRLLKLKAETGAQGFITTEKDQINLGSLGERLQPLEIARLAMTFVEPDVAIRELLSALKISSG
jgi:tetraacyldisaccharide 4'-kinase